MQRAARLISTLKLSPGLDDIDRRVRSAWKLAAGKKVSAHTQAVALVRGALIVEVEDPVWQRQLNTLSGFILSNLTKALGEGVVTSLDFRPAPPRRPVRAASHASGIEDPVMAMIYARSERANEPAKRRAV
jgi:Dna[CI] antecedent, DciA